MHHHLCICYPFLMTTSTFWVINVTIPNFLVGRIQTKCHLLELAGIRDIYTLGVLLFTAFSQYHTMPYQSSPVRVGKINLQ